MKSDSELFFYQDATYTSDKDKFYTHIGAQQEAQLQVSTKQQTLQSRVQCVTLFRVPELKITLFCGNINFEPSGYR